MKPILTLKKHNSRIQVYRENGMHCFDYGRGHKEWIIKKELERFVQYLENCGYVKV